MSSVVEINIEEKTGAYVPLTEAGTMIVDGVLVSCYTNTNHFLAHIVLAPLRWVPSLLLDNVLSQEVEGIRTIPGIIRKVGIILGLVTTEIEEKDRKSSLTHIGQVGHEMDSCTIQI